jgi:hypothetical protein
MPSSRTTFGAVNTIPLTLPVDGGDITLTNEQAAILYIVLSGVLAGDFNLTFPALGTWQVDTSQVSFAGSRVNVVNGSASAAVTTPGVITIATPAVDTIVTSPAAPSLGATLIIFRPGGVSGGNVYTDETALADATQAVGGPYMIFWDLSLAPTPGFYTFTTVGTLDLAPGGIWTDGGYTAGNGSPAQYSNQLTFQNGTVMPNPPSDLYGFLQIECNQPYPNIAWDDTTHSGKTTFHDFTGAWCNAGMAPLIHSDNDWLVVATDGANFNYGPVASGPLAAVDLDYLLQVNLYAAGQGNSSYMGPKTINFGFSAAGVGFIDPTLYPFMQLVGLFVDPTGTGNTTIPAPSAGTEESDLALLFVEGGANPGTFYYSDGTNWVPVAAVASVTAGTNVTLTGTPTNPIVNASGGGGGFTPAYGSVQNTATTSVLGGANVAFNLTAGPSAGVAQATAGLTVAAAGTYQYYFQVRGTPTNTLTPPAPLIYALKVGGVLQPSTQFASDTQSTSLAAAGTEMVTGQGLITLGAGAVVALSNQTESGVTPAGDTGLASAPLGGTATVNVQLSLVRVA